MTDETSIALIDPSLIAMPTEIFRPGEFESILEQIAARARSEVPDASTHKGRTAIASLAHKVARSKTALDDAGKSLVAGWKQQSALVDAERKRARDFLHSLKDEVRRSLTEWEQEQERIEREAAEAKARAEQEAQRAREAAEADEAEAKKRADDLEHRMSLRDDIINDLSIVVGLSDRDAGDVADALLAGQIRHLTINY